MKTIKQHREHAGMTQLELAIRIGVTPSSVYKWERALNEPSARNLREIARVFGVSMDDISLEPWDEKERQKISSGALET